MYKHSIETEVLIYSKLSINKGTGSMYSVPFYALMIGNRCQGLTKILQLFMFHAIFC